jgi:CheY-like chemotaxis protein
MAESSVIDSPVAAQRQCILVVEDEMLLAMMLEDMLDDLGYRTIKAARLAKATELAATAEVDCAILDVNLDRETSYPVAEALRQRGIPFVFSTGYGAVGLNTEYRDCPILSKPYSQQELKRVLAKTLALSALKM